VFRIRFARSVGNHATVLTGNLGTRRSFDRIAKVWLDFSLLRNRQRPKRSWRSRVRPSDERDLPVEQLSQLKDDRVIECRPTQFHETGREQTQRMLSTFLFGDVGVHSDIAGDLPVGVPYCNPLADHPDGFTRGTSEPIFGVGVVAVTSDDIPV